MGRPRGDYIPALKYPWLTSAYDPLLRWILREAAFKRRLVEQARIEPGQRVLDLGCGTATLTLLIKSPQPEATVVGLDADPRALALAGVKAARAGLDITLDQGMADELVYVDHCFDRVLSSLLFHHLTLEKKMQALREAFRVLRPGGELHVADWGRPQNALLRVAFLLVQILDGFETTAESVRGLLPELINQAGFEGVAEAARYTTPFGTLCLYRGRRPRR
ncbi:MAG: class I SAM-dependent methyltransferase [Terriglobia bacterium]